MKARNLAVLVATLVIANGSVFAEQSLHPDVAPASQPSGMGMMSGGMMMDSKMMESMQENMKKMQAQMTEIRNSKDDETRERLMGEHMQTMEEGMAMMRGMGGDMMQGMMGSSMQNGKRMEGGMMKDGEGMQGGMAPSDSDMMGRMNMMEQRMDMMQMMMEQQVESQKVELRHDHRKTKQ